MYPQGGTKYPSYNTAIKAGAWCLFFTSKQQKAKWISLFGFYITVTRPNQTLHPAPHAEMDVTCLQKPFLHENNLESTKYSCWDIDNDRQECKIYRRQKEEAIIMGIHRQQWNGAPMSNAHS